MSFHKIVVALDDSELSKAVFNQAITLAQNNKASLLLYSGLADLTLVPPTNLTAEIGLFPQEIMGSTTYQAQQANLEHQTETAKSLLQQYEAAAQQLGLQVQTAFEVGDIEALLCATAQDWGADLIVVGRRGRKGLSEALLGSVSNYAVHNAHCSVLVVQGETEPHA
ncbi:universal stress protein [Stenomitos frigidus]|uniref:Universal stress protein n=1 Tax=Stenomitos frigidus ULC18 TaxID=2107698 RepID=A0A2T1DZE1_9CYAN|nr:universal stress protein [Stenomitos frigidus]PSB25866.1 universal stress protein [Stenomitos frigidus ULC18]